MSKVAKVFATRDFELAVKSFKKDHKDNLLAELYDAVDDLIHFRITTQKRNHPLKKAEGHIDLHLDGGNWVLIYRYDNDMVIISLRLQDVVDHKELASYDTTKYKKPAQEYNPSKIQSSAAIQGSYDFDTWYDSLDANAQSQVDDIADEAGIPFYDEATSSDLAWLRDMYESKYSAKVESSTELSDESRNVMYITVNSGVNADGFSIDVVDPTTDEGLFSESYHYGYNASYSREHAEHAHKDVEDSKKYGWATTYTEKPFVSDIINDICAEYNVPRQNIIVQAGKNRFSGGNVDDATVKNFKDTYLSASVSVEGTNYGGAYDIEDDMFFTKDEIVEWADSVVSTFNTEFSSNYILSDVYVDNNIIHIEISDADYVLSTEVKIDMRKIRAPKDIDKYIDTAVNQLEAEYSRITDCTYPESVTASTQYYDVTIPEFEDYVEFELGGMLVYVDESGSLRFNERDTYPDWDSFVSLEAADYPDVEIADMHQVIDDTSDLLESLMPRDPGVYQVYGTVSLCYTITGLVENQTYYDGDEDPEREYDDRYISSILNYGKSGIIDFVYNNA